MSIELPISSAITPSEISIGSFPPNAPFSQTIFKPTKTSTNCAWCRGRKLIFLK